MKLTVTSRTGEPKYFTLRSNWSDLEGDWDDRYVCLSGYFGSLDPHKMAAAEDLYAALEKIMKEYAILVRNNFSIDLDQGGDPDYDYARTALSKARGESE